MYSFGSVEVRYRVKITIVSATFTKSTKELTLYSKLFKYFLQGLIILAPITITFWAVLSLFNWVDSILPDFIHRLFPRLALDENGNPRRIPLARTV